MLATSGGASVWYQFTPTSSGVYTANTFGSNFDTLLAVYTATTDPASVDKLSEVASNDDANTGTASSVTFNVIAGTTYFVAVDGYNDGTGPAEGTFVLNLTPSTSGPTIAAFTPSTGNVGTSVIITGTGFTGAVVSDLRRHSRPPFSCEHRHADHRRRSRSTRHHRPNPGHRQRGPHGHQRTVLRGAAESPANDNFASAATPHGHFRQRAG